MTEPWEHDWTLYGWPFEEFRYDTEWKRLSTFLNGIGVTASTNRMIGEPERKLTLRSIDQHVHHVNFGTRGILIDPIGLRLDFDPPCWRLVTYLGSDVFDDTRFPELRCFASDGAYIGGDGGPEAASSGLMTTYGPENELPSEEHPRARPFQYLVCMPSKYPLLNYVPRPIAAATITLAGTETFCGLIQCTL